MKLMIDIGNSRTKFVLIQDDIAEQIQTIDNVKLTHAWFNENWQNVTQILIANVNQPIITHALELWAAEKTIRINIIESESERFGVTNCYGKPKTLGIDRWLTLIGVMSNYPNKNTLIIDSGTATTIDFLTADGKHQGGWILPGINTLFESILAKTSNVNAKYISSASLSIGKNTSECVNSACWAATIGLIELSITQIKQSKTIDEIIILGGNAEALADLLNESVIIDQYLVFSGLQQYFVED
ncbi:MAG: type III pantothenate kinase [Colwellia sp.]|nr:type III pantothenate kinase [Colwellia sp.]